MARHEGDFVAAAEELETALALLAYYDRPLLSAHVRLEPARSLASSGEVIAAVVEAEAALATFRRVGMRAELEIAEALLQTFEAAAKMRALSDEGERTTKPEMPGSGILTRREQEVAALVAQGLTNREIAEQLVLSVRTVEGHIDQVLGRLGLHTRTQLAARIANTSAI